MKELITFSTAYPGSMFHDTDGQYIRRDDVPSLLAALAEAISERDRTLSDLLNAQATGGPQ